MSARWFHTVKVRLMAASALLIAASVALSTWVVLERVERRSAQALQELERDNAERVAALLGQRVVSLQRMLRVAASALPPAALNDATAAAAFLEANPALAVNFSNIYLANAQGDVLALLGDGRASRPGLNLNMRDWFKRTLGEGVPVVSAPLIGRVSREPVIQFTMPVAGPGGRTIGMLGGALRLSSRNLFDDLTYTGHSEGERVVTLVTDAAGTFISHPVRERVMRSIEAEPGLTQTVANWVAQGRPVEPSGFVAREGGRFIAFAGVPGADWVVFRLTPDAELLGGLAQARREALWWATGVALAGGLLVLALLGRLLGPLTRLRERALQLQDPTIPADAGWPQAQGEIGELGEVLQQVLHERSAGEQQRQLLLQQMGSVLAAAPVGIAITRERSFVLTGSEFDKLLGWPAGTLVGRPACEIYASQLDYERLGQEVGVAFAAGRPYFGEWTFQRRDGSSFWGRLQGRPVEAGEREAGAIWLLEDVTERREARERVSWSASHDALTLLLNRGAFEERLGRWLREAREDGALRVPATLMVLDLDGFKQVNDNAGHAAGDGVLRDVGQVLHKLVRSGDLAARLGGDEFALLLPGCELAVALPLAERLRAAVSELGVVHEGRRLRVDASIGLALVDGADAAPAEVWLARADAACYDAKRAGRGCVRLATAAPAAVAAPAEPLAEVLA